MTWTERHSVKPPGRHSALGGTRIARIQGNYCGKVTSTRELLRESYLSGGRISWHDLLPDRQLRVAFEDPREGELLEAVAGDTYLAVDRSDPVLLNATR